MRFSKLQGTGNDFILIDTLTGPSQRNWEELARAMCDRHFGIGADGLILVQDSTIADLKMRVFNADGSEPEVCGNGLRCFAKYAIEKGFVAPISSDSLPVNSTCNQDNPSLAIETPSGLRKAEAYMSENKVNRVRVNMGPPQFQPEQIPVKAEVNMPIAPGPILGYPLVISGKKLLLSLLSMGNPHAVTFSSLPVAEFPLAAIGPKVEEHPAFPQRTNFGVARVLSRGQIEARVWERGVGETLACGSAACAIAVAAQLLNYVEPQVDIMLPGGALTVSWDRVGEVFLSGPVEEVFTGEWPEGKT
ncbi:MAG: diaminopimelate epimerase [Dehalococcoidia bacterium]